MPAINQIVTPENQIHLRSYVTVLALLLVFICECSIQTRLTNNFRPPNTNKQQCRSTLCQPIFSIRPQCFTLLLLSLSAVLFAFYFNTKACTLYVLPPKRDPVNILYDITTSNWCIYSGSFTAEFCSSAVFNSIHCTVQHSERGHT